MSAEQRAKIRASQKARRDRQATPPPATPTTEQVAGANVEVASQPPAARSSLLDMVKDRIKGNSAPNQSASSASSPKVNEENFIFMLVPVASGFLAYGAGSLWADEYKMCAPTKAEVSAILKPIANIVARRIEINIAETPDIRDLRLSATALLAYIVRSALLSIEISEQLEKERAVHVAEKLTRSNGFPGTAARDRDARTGTYQGTANGAMQPGGGPEQHERIRSQPIESTSSNIETDAEYARRVISEAFKQDKLYRTDHGLL